MAIKAKKSLGQNFLSNPRILDKIVETAEITKNDTVLEIGPGTGSLTAKLAEKAGRVIAVEKDHRLVGLLRSHFDRFGNVEITEADILKLKIENLKLANYKIVGNIPYYITSHLLRTIFESWPRPELIVLTVQKEVAQRIIARPPHMSLLALSVQFYSEPKIVGHISRGNFRPAPKVDSAIIRFKPKALNFKLEEIENFFSIVRLGFSSKRKKLINNLAKRFHKNQVLSAITSVGLKETVRAQELSVEDWLDIAHNKLLPKSYECE